LLISDIDRHRSGRGDSPTGSRQARAGNTTAGVAGRLLRDTANLLRGRGVTKVLSSLVFHQVPLDEKRAGLAAIHETLPPGGSLHVADYGLQRTAKMRKRFRLVQKGDGFDNTEPYAQGILPELVTSPTAGSRRLLLRCGCGV